MSSRFLAGFIIWSLACGAVTHAHGAIVYNEASGDLSNSGLVPTSVLLGVGSNQILGTTGKVDGNTDRDYFTVTVPSGFELVSLTILSGTQSGGTRSFIGVEEGTEVTVGIAPADAKGLLGWRHYSPADIGSDILPAMGTAGFGSDGFAPPLGAGAYAFWVQDTSTGRFAYGFDLTLVRIPEPGVVAMLVTGLAALGMARRRRG